jgi:hypothetical protein
VDIAKVAIPSFAGVLIAWINANSKKKMILKRGKSSLELPAQDAEKLSRQLKDFFDQTDQEILEIEKPKKPKK